jgi:hypothetical protein
MLNLVQHLTKSRADETLKQVQGDKDTITTQFPKAATNIPLSDNRNA